MKLEQFFFPLIIIAAVVSVVVAFRKNGASVATVVQQNSPLDPFAQLLSQTFASAQSNPTGSTSAPAAGTGTATSQPLQPLPWYLTYNFAPQPPELAINSIAAQNSSGCGTCSTAYV